jgi:hypothetical protein
MTKICLRFEGLNMVFARDFSQMEPVKRELVFRDEEPTRSTQSSDGPIMLSYVTRCYRWESSFLRMVKAYPTIVPYVIPQMNPTNISFDVPTIPELHGVQRS